MAETEHDKQLFVNKFKVDLNEHIIRVSSINMTVAKAPAGLGVDGKEKCWRPSRPSFGNITFEGAEHKDSVKKIREWVKKAYDGGDARKDITIEVHNQKGEVVRTYNLFRCLPMAYSSIDFQSQGGKTTMHWTLEVRVQRIEMA